MLNRRTLIASAATVAAGTVIAGCSPGAQWNAAGSSSGGSPPPQDMHLTVNPAANASGVSPGQPVTVTADSGTLTRITLSTGGTSIAGQIGADQRSWQSTAPMAYGKTYTLSVAGTDEAGKAVSQSTVFTTMNPSKTMSVAFQANALQALTDGGTFGVGQPVCVHFGHSVGNQSAAVAALSVTVDPPVDGRWHWIDSQTVHWRPEQYWASGTTITATANMLGVNLGSGIYGKNDAKISFTIGSSRIAVADSSTHRMIVTVDGTQVKNFPISMGKGGYTTGASGETIDFWTRSGPHVVLQKTPTTRMTSASYGITDPKDPNFYDEIVYLTVRISYAGEFMHSAPWNIPDHGKRNSSHGCINLDPNDAQWVYDNFQIGDVVIVKNTPKPLPIWDGLGDWNVAWSAW